MENSLRERSKRNVKSIERNILSAAWINPERRRPSVAAVSAACLSSTEAEATATRVSVPEVGRPGPGAGWSSSRASPKSRALLATLGAIRVGSAEAEEGLVAAAEGKKDLNESASVEKPGINIA